MKKMNIMLILLLVFVPIALFAAFGPRLILTNEVDNKYMHIFIFENSISPNPIYKTCLSKKGEGINQISAYMWEFGRSRPNSILRYHASDSKELDDAIVLDSLEGIPLIEDYYKINTITNIIFYSEENHVKVKVDCIHKVIKVMPDVENESKNEE